MAEDVPALTKAVLSAANHMGFGLMSAVYMQNRFDSQDVKVRSIGNCPAAFEDVNKSIDEARADPVLQRLMASPIPFVYDQQLYVDDKCGSLWEVQARFGYSTGIATGLHLPNRRYFLIGVDRPDRLPQDEKVVSRMLADLQLLAVHAHAAAQHLLTPEPVDARGAQSLTAREIECLKWTAEGKTAWETGQILSISERTVTLHLGNAMKAMNASTKIQAVIRAVQAGYL